MKTSFGSRKQDNPLWEIFTVLKVLFLFQIHLFILWQNSRIVASRLRCSSRIHLFTQCVQNCLLFRSFYEMKFKEDCCSFSKQNVSICISNDFLEVITVTHSAENLSLSLLRLNCKICACCLSFSQLDVPSFFIEEH